MRYLSKALGLLRKVSFVLALLAPAALLAQDVIGTAIVGGRKIQILSDNTWQFEDQLGAPCFVIDADLSFCGRPSGWSLLGNKPPQITAAFERNRSDYAFFVTEAAGSSVGMSLDFLGEAVIGNVANGMGVSPADVPVFFSESVEFYGKPARRVALQAKLNGVFFIFINTYWVEANKAGQVFTYTFGDQLRDSDVALHKQVVSSLSFAESSK